jgi:hypothetical protein
MNDTAPEVAALVADRHRRMTPAERVAIASALFDTARAIVESSLPAALAPAERRLALARRLYGRELPEAALRAFADYTRR